MTYAIIENGKVINVIIAEQDFVNLLIQEGKEVVSYEEVNADDTKVARIGDDYISGLFITKSVSTTIDSVTDLQARLALEQIGKLETVEIMAKANPLFSIWFDRALNWRRDNEYVINTSIALGMSEAELDSLFLLASTL